MLTAERTNVDSIIKSASKGPRNVVQAGSAIMGPTYRVFSKQLGRGIRCDFLSWGRGKFQDMIFFRAVSGHPTFIVGVDRDEPVTVLPPREDSEI